MSDRLDPPNRLLEHALQLVAAKLQSGNPLEVHAPDRVDDQWVQQVAENAIEEEFGKALTLWSANEDEALQYLRPDPGATRGLLDLANGVPLVWHLLPIV